METAGTESLKQALLGAESTIRDTYTLTSVSLSLGSLFGNRRNLKSLTQYDGARESTVQREASGYL